MMIFFKQIILLISRKILFGTASMVISLFCCFIAYKNIYAQKSISKNSNGMSLVDIQKVTIHKEAFRFISKNEKRPNILLILADDMGYSDIGCYGGEIATPNLDRLAANGLRFSQFYNGARCCPTRSSLLTGLYAHQTGIGGMVGAPRRGKPAYQGDLNNNCVTIPEALRLSGYNSFMTGKWHLSSSVDTSDKHTWPLQRGFDQFYGIITGASSYFQPSTLTYNNAFIKSPDNYYFTDAISDSMAIFIKRNSEKSDSKPFFGYLAYTAPHWPLHAPEKEIMKYKGKFSKGWDTLRAEKLRRIKKLGLLPINTILSKRDSGIKEWDNVENKNKEERLMEVYAAMIDIMDQGIGRVIQTLKETGQFDNTIIIFMSDNGGCAEFLGKDMAWVKRYGPKKTITGKEVIYGNDVDIYPGGDNTYQSYGKAWANLSNTPFRYYKHYIQEGGIASPLIIHWPNGIDRGMRTKILDQPIHIIDIMPTLLSLTSSDYPRVFNENHIFPMEGKSLVPLIKGNMKWSREKPIFWEHEGKCGMREGDWKITKIFKENWELYNIKTDRTEIKNLAKKYPNKFAKMIAAWDHWAKRVGAV